MCERYKRAVFFASEICLDFRLSDFVAGGRIDNRSEGSSLARLEKKCSMIMGRADCRLSSFAVNVS